MPECPLPTNFVLVKQEVCLPSAPVKIHTFLLAGAEEIRPRISELLTWRLTVPQRFFIPEQSGLSLSFCYFRKYCVWIWSLKQYRLVVAWSRPGVTLNHWQLIKNNKWRTYPNSLRLKFTNTFFIIYFLNFSHKKNPFLKLFLTWEKN